MHDSLIDLFQQTTLRCLCEDAQLLIIEILGKQEHQELEKKITEEWCDRNRANIYDGFIEPQVDWDFYLDWDDDDC